MQMNSVLPTLCSSAPCDQDRNRKLRLPGQHTKKEHTLLLYAHTPQMRMLPVHGFSRKLMLHSIHTVMKAKACLRLKDLIKKYVRQQVLPVFLFTGCLWLNGLNTWREEGSCPITG